MTLPTKAAIATAATTGNGPQAWPTELALQMQALRDALQQGVRPLSSVQVAAGFRRVKPEKVEPLLATLAALSLVRQTAEGAYVTGGRY